MPEATPPAEFFDLVQDGDRVATAEFVDRYGGVAYTLLRARFSQLASEDCEELVQDVLVNVIAGLRNYDRDQPFKPWFLTITRRRALDFIKRHADEWVLGERGSVPLHISFEDATGPGAPKSLKAQVLDATSRELEVDVALDTNLPNESRTVKTPLAAKLSAIGRWVDSRSDVEKTLLDHYVLGSPWEEIVERLSALGETISPAAARVRGHRLIAKAKKEIGLEKDEPPDETRARRIEGA